LSIYFAPEFAALTREHVRWEQAVGMVTPGVRSRGKALDEVSTAILGGAAAENVELSGWATITEKL